MIEYNEFEVTLLEDLKDILSESEVLKDYLKREDIYLLDVPEDSKEHETVVRLNYITDNPTVFYGSESHGDSYVIQIDVWKRIDSDNSVALTRGLANRVRKVLKDLDFITQSSEDTGKEGDVNMYKVSRRYLGVLRKSY